MMLPRGAVLLETSKLPGGLLRRCRLSYHSRLNLRLWTRLMVVSDAHYQLLRRSEINHAHPQMDVSPAGSL